MYRLCNNKNICIYIYGYVCIVHPYPTFHIHSYAHVYIQKSPNGKFSPFVSRWTGNGLETFLFQLGPSGAPGVVLRLLFGAGPSAVDPFGDLNPYNPCKPWGNPCKPWENPCKPWENDPKKVGFNPKPSSNMF